MARYKRGLSFWGSIFEVMLLVDDADILRKNDGLAFCGGGSEFEEDMLVDCDTLRRTSRADSGDRQLIFSCGAGRYFLLRDHPAV